MSSLDPQIPQGSHSGPPLAGRIKLTIPADFAERYRKAKARLGVSDEVCLWPMRYGGHDVSREPRDERGRWTAGAGVGKRKPADRDSDHRPVSPSDQQSPENVPATGSPSDVRNAIPPKSAINPSTPAQGPGQTPHSSRQSDKRQEPELTFEQKKNLWAKQDEIRRLQEGIRNFEEDLKNPNLSPSHRKSLQRGMDECRDNLAQLIYETNGFIATGNLAKGNDPVATMSILRKLEAALQRAIESGQLSADVREKLEELLRPENLAMMAAFVAGYAAAHATPLAPGLAVADAYMFGSAATEAGIALFQVYLDLDSATTAQELEQASKSLSKLLAGPIVDALMKVVVGSAAKGTAAFNNRFHVPGKVHPNTPGTNVGSPKFKETPRNPSTGATQTPPGKPSVPTNQPAAVPSSGSQSKSPIPLPHRPNIPLPSKQSPFQRPANSGHQRPPDPPAGQCVPSRKPSSPPDVRTQRQSPSPNVRQNSNNTDPRQHSSPNADRTQSKGILNPRLNESIGEKPVSAKPSLKVETDHVRRRSANGNSYHNSTGGTVAIHEMASGKPKAKPKASTTPKPPNSATMSGSKSKSAGSKTPVTGGPNRPAGSRGGPLKKVDEARDSELQEAARNRLPRVDRVHPLLPVRRGNGPTHGIFNDKKPLKSGWDGGDALAVFGPRMRGLPRRRRDVLKHVEAHAVAEMVKNNLKEASLHINYKSGPCSICRSEIPKLLKDGQKLWVIFPNGGGYFTNKGWFRK